jgi:glutaminyl-tRNA synthetase
MTMSDEHTAEAPPAPVDFIRSIVAEDLASGKHGGRVATRFPPEPNGYLHIGHAKSICLNFGIADETGGTCNLRFDDTNPAKEDVEYVDAIKEDVAWLGFEWDALLFASDYFERLYELAVELIKQGKAYVDSLTADEIRAHRGTLTEPGKNGPYRNRSVDENLDLFSRMRAREFPDGTHVLVANFDSDCGGDDLNTVTSSLQTKPSWTRKRRMSVPLQLAAGLKFRRAPEPDNTPLVGGATQ